MLVAAECIFCAHSLAEQHSTENKSYYKYIENNCGHFDYTKISKHPRILMLEEDKKDILENLKNNPRIARIHESILKCADSILTCRQISGYKQAEDSFLFRKMFYPEYSFYPMRTE
ncbi:MAG: hypothetical protein ACLUKN_17545 [Bacilli bacterium]